jgi:hypothetical protein
MPTATVHISGFFQVFFMGLLLPHKNILTRSSYSNICYIQDQNATIARI